MPATDDASDEPAVACTATESDRERRWNEQGERLAPKYRGATELEDGYRLAFEGDHESLAVLAAFVADEAECCSFASFRIEYEPPYEEVSLTFTGPEGTRELLREGLFEEYEAFAAPS